VSCEAELDGKLVETLDVGLGGGLDTVNSLQATLKTCLTQRFASPLVIQVASPPTRGACGFSRMGMFT